MVYILLSQLGRKLQKNFKIQTGIAVCTACGLEPVFFLHCIMLGWGLIKRLNIQESSGRAFG
jgi:hypothetical protein